MLVMLYSERLPHWSNINEPPHTLKLQHVTGTTFISKQNQDVCIYEHTLNL